MVINMKTYPYYRTLQKELAYLGGNLTGIFSGVTIASTYNSSEPNLKTVLGYMPSYHKYMLDNQDLEVQYHISGYGSYYEEAMIKYMGESIERYASVIAPAMAKNQIHYATYKELSASEKTMPLDYINILTEEQLQHFNKSNRRFATKHADENTVLGWVKCPSILNKNEFIWTPAQMLFLGYLPNERLGERLFVPSFTTGTASHRTTQKALLNALIEFVQVDAFIINWYTKRKMPVIEIDSEVVKAILKACNLADESAYEVIPVYMTLEDIDFPSFGVILKSKKQKIPNLFMGIQGDFDVEHGVLRGVMEGATISAMGIYNHMMSPDLTYETIKNSDFGDLDGNVIYYSRPEEGEVKFSIFEELMGEKVKLSLIPDYKTLTIAQQITSLIQQIKKVSEYAVYLDITPTELADDSWSVMRVFIPEMMQICLPGIPFKNHPRFKKFGGIKNEYPHPLP